MYEILENKKFGAVVMEREAARGEPRMCLEIADARYC